MAEQRSDRDSHPLPLGTVLEFPAAPRDTLPASSQGGLGPSPTKAPPAPERLWREIAGDVIRTERQAQQRTLAETADRAGISPQYLSEVERGRKEPSSEMLSSICGALGLTLDDLLAGGRQLIGTSLARIGSAGRRPGGARASATPTVLALAG